MGMKKIAGPDIKIKWRLKFKRFPVVDKSLRREDLWAGNRSCYNERWWCPLWLLLLLLLSMLLLFSKRIQTKSVQMMGTDR